MSPAIYQRTGATWTPTEWAGSPWSSRSQHGGPVNALCMHATCEAAADAGMRPARLTVDLLKPVPMEPLVTSWRYLRKGRRMAVVEVGVAPGEGASPCASARAVLLAAREDFSPAWRIAPDPPPPVEDVPEGSFMPRAYLEKAPPGFHRSVEVRIADDRRSGWMTTRLDLAEGEPLTPLERGAALCDLTFGLGTRLRPRVAKPGVSQPGMLINTDTTLHLERAPEGDWLGFRSAFLADDQGIGLAELVLYDARGRVGRSTQTLLENG